MQNIIHLPFYIDKSMSMVEECKVKLAFDVFNRKPPQEMNAQETAFARAWLKQHEKSIVCGLNGYNRNSPIDWLNLELAKEVEKFGRWVMIVRLTFVLKYLQSQTAFNTYSWVESIAYNNLGINSNSLQTSDYLKVGLYLLRKKRLWNEFFGKRKPKNPLNRGKNCERKQKHKTL